MNRLFSKRFRMLFMVLIIFSSVSFSQFDKLNFLKSVPADGVKFVEAYITPWANAFGAGLNGSWYNTAKPHKLGGFDITMGVNAGMVPVADQTFDLSTLGLSANISPKTGTAPTVAGSKSNGPAMTYSVSGVNLASVTSPPGTGWKYVPVPTAQIGIGLPLGTEIKGRFIPKIPLGDNDVSLWGIGLVHSIMQYIPGNELLPVDVSIFAGYTKLTGNVALDLQPETISGHAPNYTTYNLSTSFNDQLLSATVEALNVSAIASVTIPVITFYGGLGYSKTSTEIKLKGNFPTPVLVTPALPATPYAEYNDSGVKKDSDFPAIDIKSFSGLRANIGFRIKLAVITIHADYTRAQYNVFSTGLGISFR
jgi:hypothetical protein